MRILPQNLSDTLEHCTVYETLYLELASGAILRFAVGEVVIGGETYLGKLTVTSPLRMTLTKASDNVSMEIDNTTLELGQALISEPNVFDGSFAVFGAYFKNNSTGAEWHDEKLPGEITASSIDGDKIIISFLSELDAANYQGRLIADVFPNAQLQRNITPVETVGTAAGIFGSNDISMLSRKLAPLMDEMDYGRYYLPDMQIQEF